MRYRQTTMRFNNSQCNICGHDNSENISEHVNLIKDTIIKQPNHEPQVNTYEILLKISNKFNETIRTNAEEKKPPSGAIQIITGKNHRRFHINNSSGIECEKCEKLFSITNEIEKYLICPHCGTEQKINQQNIIQL